MRGTLALPWSQYYFNFKYISKLGTIFDLLSVVRTIENSFEFSLPLRPWQYYGHLWRAELKYTQFSHLKLKGKTLNGLKDYHGIDKLSRKICFV